MMPGTNNAYAGRSPGEVVHQRDDRQAISGISARQQAKINNEFVFCFRLHPNIYVATYANYVTAIRLMFSETVSFE